MRGHNPMLTLNPDTLPCISMKSTQFFKTSYYAFTISNRPINYKTRDRLIKVYFDITKLEQLCIKHIPNIVLPRCRHLCPGLQTEKLANYALTLPLAVIKFNTVAVNNMVINNSVQI